MIYENVSPKSLQCKQKVILHLQEIYEYLNWNIIKGKQDLPMYATYFAAKVYYETELWPWPLILKPTCKDFVRHLPRVFCNSEIWLESNKWLQSYGWDTTGWMEQTNNLTGILVTICFPFRAFMHEVHVVNVGLNMMLRYSWVSYQVLTHSLQVKWLLLCLKQKRNDPTCGSNPWPSGWSSWRSTN